MTSWELHLAGDGPLRTDLARLAAALHIEKKVLFHGFVPWGEALFCLYDGMDLFVLSSINEGMPRALLEAMARGLPCISATVPGASELLAPEALVPTGREDLLASRILTTLQSPGALDQNAARCWERVQAFRIPRLLERKRQYLLDFHAYVCSVDHAVHPTRQRYHPGL
jgi:glycosyltransferase involved in cell wall biosynthesis